MTFIHGYLLGGLILAGIPVLLHLLMRQKPKRLPFPAFRFLKARQQSNQRRMQIQHLLLLLLRVCLLVALCLGLARPRLFSHRNVAGKDRSVQAALLFDTSPSMEYNSGGVTRLDEARNRARELLGDLKSDSRVAVIDAGEERGDAFQSIAEARTRLESLKIRPGVGSLNLAVERALRLLQKQETSEEGQPRVLYVFTDRTRPSWDPGGSKPVVPEGLTVLVVDVGLDEPKDLGISKVQVQPALVAPGARLEIRAEAGGTAQEIENQVSCQVDGENRLPDRRPFRLAKGQNSETLLFEREAPAPPASSLSEHAFQVTLLLGTRDALPFNNARHATFHVRQGRKLLTLVDRVDAQRTRIWEAAHAATRSFDCEVRTFEQAEKITDRDLASYPVVVLFEVERVPDSWWKRLATYVKAGGGLAVVPGGDEAQAQLKFFNDQGLSSGLLPAAYATLSAAPVGKSVPFERFAGNHPLMAPFVAWSRGVDPDFDRDDLRPFVRRYWKLGKLEKDSLAIARYADAEKSPALAERSVGKGKVVAFTTPLDFRFVDERRSIQWNNFWTDSSFGLVLIDRVCRYLGGEVSAPNVQFTCGEAIRVSIPGNVTPPLTVKGPELVDGNASLELPDVNGMVLVPQATAPGNYQILDSKGKMVQGFSLDVAARESDLSRIPVEELEEQFGENSVIGVNRTSTLLESLAASRPSPIELLPYLMILLLLVMGMESWLANRFYRVRPAPGGNP